MNFIRVDASHPSRVRGLKYPGRGDDPGRPPVAPFTGAWIEMKITPILTRLRKNVAPFTGAWIEILLFGMRAVLKESRTLHGCVD